MLVVGLTGQTGAGKSTAGRLFAERGVPSIDCDRVARAVTEQGSPCLDALVAEFGQDILFPCGGLDRKKLGSIVFADPQKLARLDAVIFPFILARIRELLGALETRGEPLVLLDAPTLFESGADSLCGVIVSVVAPAEIRRERIRERDGLSREEADRRMESQHDEAFFRERSDFVLENGGPPEALVPQVDEALRRLSP